MKIWTLVFLLIATNARADSIGDFSDFGPNRAYEIFTDTGNFNGVLHASNTMVQSSLNSISYLLTSNVPTSSTASCSTSLMAYDISYIYVCISTNTWRRASLSTVF